MQTYYRQCTIRKGEKARQFYLPERFAVVGKIVKLRNKQCTWSEGWVVAQVGAERIDDGQAESNCLRRLHAWTLA